ncbi:MAG: redox-sensing transcriptional repressor Rex [Clostridiales bacterium]|nr:MAG: redox-sensing transcriptional repressor Rex [Clostridiales bacterium]
MNLTLTVFRRLSLYLHYLKQLPPEVTRISATTIASDLGLGEVLVRKELSQASAAAGRPKTGYVVASLIHALENFLGYNQLCRAVVAGAGKLGRALMGYDGFTDYGLYIAAAFDINEEIIGTQEAGRPILSMEDLPVFCRQQTVDIGIITVPGIAAQSVCDRLCENGVRAIWCFAPAALSAPEGVLIQYENMAASLAMLSSHLKHISEQQVI